MKMTSQRIFRTLFVLALFWLCASPTIAGTWTYSGGLITHSETAWVLAVSPSGTSLTVAAVIAAPSGTSALPLNDAVSGYVINNIGSSAFFNCTNMTSLSIPFSVTNIESSAFYYCKGLTSVTIPGSVSSIGSLAFYGCTGLTEVAISVGVSSIGSSAFWNCTGLTGVTIPESVKTIRGSTFKGCTGLTSVTIPGCVTNVDAYAFQACTGLTAVTIPNSVKSIGGCAFKDCTGLTSVTIGLGLNLISGSGIPAPFYNCSGIQELFFNATNFPSFEVSDMFSASSLRTVVIGERVPIIGTDTFYGCTGMTNISVSVGNTIYCDLNGVLFDKNVGSLLQFPRGRKGEYIVPGSVTSIGMCAFSDCAGLTGVTIPGSVTNIGADAFSYCTGLTGVTIPTSVSTIGMGAFSDCARLTSVTIPGSVTNIGADAFSYCTGLTSMTIQDGVGSIGDGMFFKCTGLTDVTIPDSVNSIGIGAFAGCTGLTAVTIPDCVNSIGSDAFASCTGLTSVAVGRGVRSSPSGDNSPFSACFGIRELFYNATNWPSFTVSGMFPSSCEGLTNLIIGSDVNIIGSFAFNGCIGLKDISVSLGNTAYCDMGGVLFDKNVRNLIRVPQGWEGDYNVPVSVTNIGSSAFYCCTGLTGVMIPASVASIGSSAFYGCTGLNDVTIPSSVASIETRAFYGCTDLTGVNISDGVTSIGVEAFFGCTYLKYMTIPDSVISIGSKAFSGTLLTSVTVGPSVRSSTGIGTSSPFYNCFSIRELFFNATNWPSFKASDILPSSYGVLTNMVIGGEVRVIGPSAFNGCTRLTNVTILDGVSSIGTNAFSSCKGLTAVTIPDSVTNIGQSAFSSCTGLTSVAVGRGVRSSQGIGTSSPFYNCFAIRNLFFNATNWPAFKTSDMFSSSYGGLTNLVIGSNVAIIGPSAFNGCTGLTEVTIPCSVTSIGSNAFYRCNGLMRVLFAGNAPSLGLSVFASCTATVYRMAGAAGWPDVPGLWGGRPTALWYPFSSIGKTTAVQIAVENSGDGGTSVKMGGVGLLTDGEMAGIECTAMGPGVLEFDWKVSSEAGWDVLRFYEVGGAVTNVISGATAGWSRVHMAINGASDVIHTFRWEYEKDPYGDYVGQDCGWVDSIGWYPFYTLTVNGGNGNGLFTNGTSVSITADAPPAWQRFDRWTGNTNTVDNVFTSSTTLVMPAADTVVTATYAPILYTLSVVNGSGSGSYPFASTVEICAAPYAGKRFHRWAGDIDTVSDPLSATTTVVTAGHTLSISATYSVPLTVNAGTGSGWYPEGSTATITADPNPMYMEFARWTGDATGLLSNAFAPMTSLTMPTRPATLIATYQDSVARITGSYGRTYATSGIIGGLSADAAAGSPSGTPAVKLGGAGVIPDNGFAAFETIVSGRGSILFWWKVSSESNADYLKFKVDGVQVIAISGTKGPWTQVSNRVDTAGEHTLRWEYVKNGSISSSTDAGWLDDIVWFGDVQTPVLNPVIVHAALTNQNMAIQFTGERGITYLVQTNGTLNPEEWAVYQTLQPTWINESNGVHRFEILPPASAPDKLFYRIAAPLGMVAIPTGTNSGTDPDLGAYSLTVEAFFMDATEVTKAQWDEVYVWAVAHGYSFSNSGSGKASNHPVQTVSWFDCVTWCNARSQKEGRTPCYNLSDWTCNFSVNGYRLPTVTEWQYAARGGLSGKRFPWGDIIDHTRANYDGNPTSYTYDQGYDGNDILYAMGGYPYTSPAGAFAANGYGLYDMAGNVWEWCNDAELASRTLRGGCWGNNAFNLQCGSRNWNYPDYAHYMVGFRTVCR